MQYNNKRYEHIAICGSTTGTTRTKQD